MVDVLNRAYNKKYGSLFTSVISCNIFGPYDNFKPEQGHVIPGMISRMYELINISDPETPQEKKEFVIWGSGKPLRQFIYSLDLAKLIVWALRNYNKIDPITFCVDEKDEVSIGDVAKSVAKAFDFKGKLVFNTNVADGQYKRTASNAKMRALLPDFKFTEFDVAVKEMVQWYIKNYDTAKK
jgi:GDP-L-fucose synthase